MRASRGEIKIEEILRQAELPFKMEYIFPDLKAPSGRPLRFDFVKFMRNGVLKIFAALFGLGMLVSCANNKLTAEIDTLEIVFRPIVSPNTKLAYSDDKSFPATLPFRLWAFDSAGESLLDGK